MNRVLSSPRNAAEDLMEVRYHDMAEAWDRAVEILNSHSASFPCRLYGAIQVGCPACWRLTGDMLAGYKALLDLNLATRRLGDLPESEHLQPPR